ncbi:MAG: hypothetical protein JOZ72_10565 [Alphaproteobacteria bacterium]|nr:hypothetical protein [Alphaproteobacteria bacterium]
MRCAFLLAVLLAAPAALADTAPPTAIATAPAAKAAAGAPAASVPSQRIRGTIGTFDPVARTLSIVIGKKDVSVTLAANARVITNQRRKVADIKPGDFIGAAALKGSDGKLRAQQINVFPDALRGMGEGQYPMGDASSNRLMTNATVAQVTSVAANNGTLKVSYRGAAADDKGVCGGHANAAGAAGCTGDAEIVVAPGIPIIALMLGDESLLVPGAAVSVVATPSADGTLQATRLTVEKDGVKPIL